MDVTEAVETRLELREYADRPVPEGIQRAILDAGRLAPSGKNLQHWHFLLVEDADDLATLARESPSGRWVRTAAFAILVCTDPDYDYHEIDAGRAVTHMQLVAWEHGVGSCIYTGITAAARDHFEIPADLAVSAVAGFGFPVAAVAGIKDRKPLSAVASRGRFGRSPNLDNPT